MQIFYSGADQPGTPQPDSSKSLGGYVSGSLLPNGRLSNIFPSISKSTVLKTQGDIRLIVLKNNDISAYSGIIIYTNVAGSHIKLQLAAVAPAIDGCGNPVFESVMDGNTLPYQATLSYQEGSGNPINVSTLAAGGYIGLWIYREIDQTTFPALNADPSLNAQDLATLIQAQGAAMDETVQLIISYT